MTPVPAPTRRIDADVVPDLVLLAVALAAGLGAARLTRAPTAAHVLVPIAACVVAGHLVVSLVRLLRLPDPVPSIVGVLGVALVAVWTVLPASTRGGIPTSTTIRVLLRTFNAAGTVIRSQPTPVAATAGVVLCLAAGAGLAAVFARTLWSWQEMRLPGARRPLVALFPTFGLFCYTALLSSDIDRVTGTALYLATALVFLAVADRPSATRRRPSLWSGTATALAMAVVAVVVPVAVSPGVSSLRLDALPFSAGGSHGIGGASGSGGGTVAGVGALNLIDNLRAVLTARSDLVMFTATSPTPTYWQVATLSQFDGNSWIPDPATTAAALGAPQLAPISLPVLPEPSPTRTFTVNVTIADLRSTLLPVPPSTVAVGDASAVQVEPGIGVVQPFANPEELSYDATARVATTAGNAAEPTVAALDASVPASDLAPYLALPLYPSIPEPVVALAHQIVANAKGPAAEATALVRFFTQNKRFRYTLTPPTTNSGSALASFLFTTRAGFCQQFAGAYAVLARIDGLPTRLAIGFTTGSTTKRATYSVTGADAHSWPQVYLGPNAGWVSFEPTPASSDEALGAGVDNGAPTTTPGSKAPAVTTTTLSDKRLGTGARPGSSLTGVGLSPRPSTTTTKGHAAWGLVLLIALGLAAAIIAVVVAGPRLWRRRKPRLRRRRFARAGTPRTEILARWEQAASVLARTGLGRRRSETLEEHATRLVAQPHDRTPTVASVFGAEAGSARRGDPPAARALDAYRALAALAARASYAPDPCTEADLAEARRLSDELRAALRARNPGGARKPGGARVGRAHRLLAMCGRVDLHTPPAQLARLLDVALAQGVDPDGAPSWNVPPTRRLYAVTEVHPLTDDGRRSEDTVRILDQFRWGLVPDWAKDVRMGNKMINARAETVAKTPAYRSAFAAHRCLIVVDGFYEWQVPDPTEPKKKVPYYFHRADGRPITFAGLYETWWDKSRSAEPDPETLLRTCTIITTDAGPDMVEIHNRMPVILDGEPIATWLDPDRHDTDTLHRLLRPAPGGTLERHPVSTEVNSPRHDGPQLLLAAAPA